MARGLLVIGARIAGAARFRRAAEPIEGARLRQRARGDRLNATEMLGGGRRIVEIAKRIPAGMELGLDGLRLPFGGMVGDEAIGGLAVALLQKHPRDDAPLVPPCVGIDQTVAVARGALDQGRRLFDPVLLAQVLGGGEEIAGVRAQIGRHLGQERVGIAVAANGGGAGAEERFRVGEARETLRIRHAVGVKQHVHAELVIGPRQKRAEVRHHLRFGRLVELLVTPEAHDQALRLAGLTQLDIGAGKRHRAFGRARRVLPEGGHDVARRHPLAVQRALQIGADHLHAGPAAQLHRRVSDFGGRNVGRAAQGDRPGENVPVERAGRHALANGQRARNVAPGGVEPVLQITAHGRDAGHARAHGRDGGGEGHRVGSRRRARRAGLAQQRIAGGSRRAEAFLARLRLG